MSQAATKGGMIDRQSFPFRGPCVRFPDLKLSTIVQPNIGRGGRVGLVQARGRQSGATHENLHGNNLRACSYYRGVYTRRSDHTRACITRAGFPHRHSFGRGGLWGQEEDLFTPPGGLGGTPVDMAHKPPRPMRTFTAGGAMRAPKSDAVIYTENGLGNPGPETVRPAAENFYRARGRDKGGRTGGLPPTQIGIRLQFRMGSGPATPGLGAEAARAGVSVRWKKSEKKIRFGPLPIPLGPRNPEQSELRFWQRKSAEAPSSAKKDFTPV